MFKVKHIHVFVSQKVCRHPSFSVRRRTRTRLVVDTLRGYMIVEIKRKKLSHVAYGHVLLSDNLLMETSCE